MTDKHRKTGTPADLSGNLGIRQSRGLTGTDIRDIEADSTIKGDTGNETRLDGGVDPDHRSCGNE